MQDDPNKRISDAIDRMTAQGADDDEIDVVVQSIRAESTRKAPSKPSDVNGSGSTAKPKARRGAFLAPIASGLTLGASDEILGGLEGLNNMLPEALGGTGGSFSEGYERGKAKIRAGGKEFSNAHPILSPALEFAAGIATPGLGAAKFAKKGATLGGKVTRSMLANAGLGTVAGAAYSGEGSRGVGAATGAAVGGTLGIAPPLVGAAAKNFVNIAGLRTAAGVDRQAVRKLAEAASRSNRTIDEIETEGAAFATANKPAIVADLLGENGLGLTRAVTGVPGRGKQEIPAFFNERQEGQLSRVMGNIEDRLGMKGRDVYDVAEELIKTRKANAEPLYAVARPLPINKPETQSEIMELMQLPEFKAAMQRGARIAAVERNPMQGDTPLTVGDVDYMKRGLDAVIESRANSDTPISRTEARALRGRLNELLGMVDDEHPEYKTARQTFAGDKAVEDALEDGQKFLKEDHQVTAKQLSRMTDSEREMYRIGAIAALRRLGEKTPENLDKIKKLYGNPEAKARLNALLSDPEMSLGLQDDLAKESQLFRNQTGVTVGSRTTPMAAEMGDLGGGFLEAAMNVGTGNVVGLARQGFRTLAKNRGKVGHEKIANSLATKLQIKPGTPEFKALLAEMAKEMAKNPTKRLSAPAKRVSGGKL